MNNSISNANVARKLHQTKQFTEFWNQHISEDLKKETKRWTGRFMLEDHIKTRNTWISLPQSTGSLTTNTALTDSERTLHLGVIFRETIRLVIFDTWSVVHLLYWDTGSIFSKKEAYSSKERTFLPTKINETNEMLQIWKKKKA